MQLSTYNGSSLPVLGEAEVIVIYGNQFITDNIVVEQGGNHALLGRNWLLKLKLDWNSLFSNVNAIHSNETKPDIPARFPAVFADGLGTVSVHQTVINLKEGATPKCWPPRPVPFAMRQAVDLELDRLQQEGIIVPVESAEWARPLVIVKKKNGNIQICTDFRVTVNPLIDPHQYPIPDPNELISRLSGCSVFSTLDLSQAYAQLPLSKDSQKYCVISTHRGLFANQRLPFGISSAPAIWQKTMDQILQGLKGTGCFYDDDVVGGRDDDEHDMRLEEILSRFSERGIRLRVEKCEIRAPSVQYLSFMLYGQEVQTKDDKIAPISDAPASADASALKSFLGCVNFYNRFIPNKSAVLQPLNCLLGKNILWSRQQRVLKLLTR